VDVLDAVEAGVALFAAGADCDGLQAAMIAIAAVAAHKLTMFAMVS
jgi:hypothetical protein